VKHPTREVAKERAHALHTGRLGDDIDNRFSSALHQIKSSAIPSQKGADGTHHGSVRPCLFGLLLISSAIATSNWTRIDVSGIPDDRPVFLLVASSVQTSFNLNQRPVFESPVSFISEFWLILRCSAR
jgi:hypothetical protein